MADIGDLVKVEGMKGTLMPTNDPKLTIIKLESGYNMVFKNKKPKLLKKKEENKLPKVKEPKKDPKLKTISILHTGGTIASKVDYKSGGVIAGFELEDLLEMFPELKKIANINSVFVSNMMSEDMRFSHYKKLAKTIKEEIDKGADGIIIGHGTDTIAVTAAALSFMLENPPIPVILVGSQRSSDRGSSDAAMNLICASTFITNSDFKGVALCMHEDSSDKSCLIMPGTKTRKLHTSRRDAFKPVNASPIAKVNYDTKKIEMLKDTKAPAGDFNVHDRFEEKVTIIRTHPNMSPDFFELLIKNDYKGLILEATGIGQAPTNIKENLPIYEALKKFIEKGGIVGLTSQCIFGRVHEDIYTNCRRLKDIGVIFCEDMLTDTAYVKLAWLLANKKDKAASLLCKNMIGEITERTEENTFL